MEQGIIEVNASVEAPLVRQSELDSQLRIAAERPRSIQKFMDRMKSIACISQEVAKSCFYSLPRGKNNWIEGPSVRLAEIAVSEWGNCQAGARVVEVGERTVTAQGIFRDLEKNTIISFEVSRRITDREGKRFSDDMITVTGNAAASIALRNAVFKGIPKAFWESAYESARSTAVGDQRPISQQRTEMIQAFAKMGIGLDQILAVLERRGEADIDLEDIRRMHGLFGAIRNGEADINEVFPEEADEAPGSGDQAGQSTRAAAVGAKLKKKAAKVRQAGSGDAPAAEAKPETVLQELKDAGLKVAWIPKALSHIFGRELIGPAELSAAERQQVLNILSAAAEIAGDQAGEVVMFAVDNGIRIQSPSELEAAWNAFNDHP